MYVPDIFANHDPQSLRDFITRYSFATLVTGGASPFVTHTPLILDPTRGEHGTLLGHFARANGHGGLDHEQAESVAIFHGPHAYISPTWYPSGLPAVPTWNYATVHATGRLSIIDDADAIAGLLEHFVSVYEGPRTNPWKNELPADTMDKLVRAVTAFEMPIQTLVGKFKLGQNRKPEDQLGAIQGLESTTDPGAGALARFARDYLDKPIESDPQ